MLGFNRRTRRTAARGLLALMSSLWLMAAAAPCVMAAPHCPGMEGQPCESMDHAMPTDTSDCDSLQVVDCQREDVALASRSTAPDFHAEPMLLVSARTTVWPAAQPPRLPDPDRLIVQFSPLPLYLQHAALLF